MKTLALIVISAAICFSLPSALAQAVIDPLQRDAIVSRKIDGAVLLSSAIAGKRVVAVGERGLIALSDDQGKTWRQARKVPTSVTLTAVVFISEKSGWVVGHAGVVLQTADGGETWARRLDGNLAAQLTLNSAQAAQRRGAPDGDRLVNEAKLLVKEGADKPFFDIESVDEKHAIVVGASGLIFSTTDGGATWEPWMDRIDNAKALNIYAIRRYGQNLLLAGEQGLILRSINEGKSFTPLKSPYVGSWFALAFQGADEFVVGGLRGTAYRGNSDGKTWTRLEGISPLSITAVDSINEHCVLFANQGGQLFSLAKHENIARRLSSPPLPPITTILRKSNSGWLVFTMHGIFQLSQLETSCTSFSLPGNGKP